MTFEAWLKREGYDAEKLTDKNRAHLEAAWKAETQPPEKKPDEEPKNSGGDDFVAKMKAIDEEEARIAYIKDATLLACQRHRGEQEKIKRIQELAQAAIADPKTDRRAFDLAMIRANNWLGPMQLNSRAPQMNADVLEAAVCMTMRLANVEKKYTDETLQAAHTQFRRGIGLQELLLLAAERNSGYRGTCRDVGALCRAAFPQSGRHAEEMYAAAGPSTIDVAGILSNVGNKFLAAGFLYTEQTWRQIARIRPANDYKQLTTYRLTGNNKFAKVPAGGEIQHGTLGELPYTNQVDIYGKMLGIDERDIRNDDLGAFTGAADELGRGAGDSLNEIFWAEWVDDSTFFPTDKSNANYDDGSTDSVLTLAGLNNAETIFRLQTKPDGTPLGAMPAIILTPATLYNSGLTLMASQGLVVGTTPASGPGTNVFFGRYRVYSSVYLDAVPTIGTTAWYLLADPNNIAGIEVAFLDGMDTPTIETSTFDFNRLGLAMRGTHRFGCSKQEYRCGVKLKGAT